MTDDRYDDFEWEDPRPRGHAAVDAAGRYDQPGPPGDAGRPPEPAPSPGQRRLHRRRSSAGAVLAAMLIGFFVAGLLDARAIEHDVKGQPLGARRSALLVLLKPMTALSAGLSLDRPAIALDTALGRDRQRHHRLAEVKRIKRIWPRHITPGRPLKLYVAGDSLAQTFGSSLVNMSEETHLVRAKLESKVSTGLTRPDFFDWPQHFVDVIVDSKPQAVAVLFGANDGQNVDWDGKVLKTGSNAWRDVYRMRVGQAMEILTSGGRRVYWVGNPIMRDARYGGTIAMMNKIYEAEARQHQGVTYVDTWRLLSDKKGRFAEYLPDESGDMVLMRQPDGIHLTVAGGDRMARAVLDAIERDWSMPSE